MEDSQLASKVPLASSCGNDAAASLPGSQQLRGDAPPARSARSASGGALSVEASGVSARSLMTIAFSSQSFLVEQAEPKPTTVARPIRPIAWAACALCILWQIGVLLLPLITTWDQCDVTSFDTYNGTSNQSLAEHQGWDFWSWAISTVILLWPCGWFIWNRHKRGMSSPPAEQQAGWSLVLSWAAQQFRITSTAIGWCVPAPVGPLLGGVGIFWGISYFVRAVQQERFIKSMQTRIEMTESAFGRSLGSWTMVLARGGVLFFGLLATLESFLKIIPDPPSWITVLNPFLSQTSKIFNYSNLVFFLFVACLLFWALTVVIKKVKPAAFLAEGEHATPMFIEADWSLKLLQRLRTAMVLPTFLVAVRGFIKNFFTFSNAITQSVTLATLTALPLIVESICLMVIVKVFQAGRPLVDVPEESEHNFVVSENKKKVSPHSEKWQEQVRVISCRGISVNDVLRFYCLLGKDVMPHYDASKSTTNDVVRQAIIPLSRTAQGGMAYSEVRSHCLDWRVEEPSRMITHAWCSLFVDLVASVVASALGQDSYGGVRRRLLKGDFAALDAALRKRQVGQMRYWMCVFCVNQHTGICSGFGNPPPQGSDAFNEWDEKRRDSVTKEIYPVCACPHPKYFNDQADLCEMNKFNDVMGHLVNADPRFQQVIFVDPECTAFTRAWCVAETVEAHARKVTQRPVMRSRRALALDSNDFDAYAKLVNLSVVQCEASRPEDRELILQSIPDVPRFDARLQWIIFGDQGLLKEHFDGFGVLAAAAKIARRADALNRGHLSRGNTVRADADSTQPVMGILDTLPEEPHDRPLPATLKFNSCS